MEQLARSGRFLHANLTLLSAVLAGGVALSLAQATGARRPMSMSVLEGPAQIVPRCTPRPLVSGWAVPAAVLAVFPFVFGWPEWAWEPITTTAIVLLGLVTMAAGYGPAAERRACAAFAVVGWTYLGLAFGPPLGTYRSQLPTDWLIARFVRVAIPFEYQGTIGPRTHATRMFILNAHVLFALLAGHLAARLSRGSARVSHSQGPLAERSEPCP